MIFFSYSYAAAYVVPDGACHPAYNGDPGVARLIWESEPGNSNPSFDIPDVALIGGASPQVCLYGIDRNLTLAGGFFHTLLASRFLTVPAPPPPPTQVTPPSVAALSRGAAVSKAKAALRKRFGRAYVRGKRKRLSCAKQSATRYRCTFSFRHRKKRRGGIVTVAIQPNGSVTTTIKRG